MTDSLKTILCIGDSLTEGDYGSEPEGTANVHPEGYPYFLEKYLGVTAINAGKCGFTSLDYWKYTLKTLDLSTADAAVIMLGTNGGITDTIETGHAHFLMHLPLCRSQPPSPPRKLCRRRQRCYPEDCSEIPSSPAGCKSGAWRQRLQHQNHAACGWPSRQLPFLQQTWNLHWKSRSLPL